MSKRQSILEQAAQLYKAGHFDAAVVHLSENEREEKADRIRQGDTSFLPSVRFKPISEARSVLRKQDPPIENILLTDETKRGKFGRVIKRTAGSDGKFYQRSSSGVVQSNMLKGYLAPLGLIELLEEDPIIKYFNKSYEKDPFKISSVDGTLIGNYIAEGGSLTSDDPTFDVVVNFTPQMNYSLIWLTRNVILTAPSIMDDLVMNVLELMADRATVKAAFYGTGTGKPLGLHNNTDFSQKLAGASAGKLVFDNAEKLVDTSGAPKENRAYFLHPDDAETLKSRPVIGVNDRMIIQNGKLNDQDYEVSTLITKGDIWYGYWPTALINEFWREFLVDPFTEQTDVLFKLFVFNNVGFRNLDRVVLIQNFD